MSFHDRTYDVYAILGDGRSLPWSSLTWASISEALAQLTAHTRGPAAIRSTQLSGEAPKMRQLSFGRLGLDAKSADKWTHVRPGQLAAGTRSAFLTTELWAPSWTVCERERVPPDIYFEISSSGGELGMPSDDRSFGSVSLLAVAEDLKVKEASEGVAKNIARAVGTVLAGRDTRPWGRSSGAASFTDAINDLVLTGLFVPGPRHDRPVDLSLFKGRWAPLAVDV